MGDFVKLNTPLPAQKMDANPPQGLPSELDAADINSINSALGDLRTNQAGVVSAKTWGLACDGVTDDTAALSAMVAALGTTQKITLSLQGLSVVNSNVTIPTNIRVRLEGEGSGFIGSGTVTFVSWSPHLNDARTLDAPLIDMDHYATSIVNGFGINIRNQADNPAAPTAGTGASSAIVIHQYSDVGPAMQIDNTRSGAFLRFKEASNPTNSAGTQGTGDFFSFYGYTAGSPTVNLEIGRLDQFLAFRSTDSSRPWQFVGGSTGPALQIAQGAAGVGLNIIQSGAGNAVSVSQTGAANGVVITPGSGADNFWPLLVSGRTSAASFSSSLSAVGLPVVNIAKNGTGTGDVLDLTNKGTGKSVNLSDGTNNLWWLDNVGKQNVRTGGTADTAGKAVLVAGTVTVPTTAVTANSIIILTRQTAGGTVGVVQVGAITAGTSFRIDSVQPGTASTVQAADTSTIAWHIIN